MGDKKHKTTWNPYKGKARQAELAMELARFNGALSRLHRHQKYARMSFSPFTFYRGTAHLFYRDLASEKLIAASRFVDDKTVTWIQGDLHQGNFGAFADSDGEIVFDLNDFDESWVSCYLYDIWRGAVSLVLTGRENGFSDKKIHTFLKTFANRYLDELARCEGKDGHGLDQVTVENSHGPLRKFLKKAAKKSRKDMLDKWTVVRDGERCFDLISARLAPVSDGDARLLRSAISVYKDNLESDLRGRKGYFKVLDVAKRLEAGIGSLGTPRYYALIRGEDDTLNTSLILDIKEQSMPSFFPFLPEEEKQKLLRVFDEERAGLRVAEAQRAMLMDPDKHLGGITILGHSFSVRERSPYKKSFKVEKLVEFDDFNEMAHHWGTILAAAHARADKDRSELVSHHLEEEVLELTRGKEDKFTEEILDFAMGYADQVEIDHALFLDLTS